MKIIKYKKVKNSSYEIILEDNSKIVLNEDLILQEELLLKKEINDIKNLLEKNKKYEIYTDSLNYLNHKLRTKQELKEYLEKKDYQEKDIINNIIKLESQGYLNDYRYTEYFIKDRINLSLDGPNKIKDSLEKLGVETDIINEYLYNIDNKTWFDRIEKYVSKQLKSNKKSSYVFKNKMLINLMNLGYFKEDINECLSRISITNQDDLKEKEKEKLIKKMSKKYTGVILDRKVKEKLYQKGFFD